MLTIAFDSFLVVGSIVASIEQDGEKSLATTSLGTFPVLTYEIGEYQVQAVQVKDAFFRLETAKSLQTQEELRVQVNSLENQVKEFALQLATLSAAVGAEGAHKKLEDAGARRGGAQVAPRTTVGRWLLSARISLTALLISVVRSRLSTQVRSHPTYLRLQERAIAISTPFIKAAQKTLEHRGLLLLMMLLPLWETWRKNLRKIINKLKIQIAVQALQLISAYRRYRKLLPVALVYVKYRLGLL